MDGAAALAALARGDVESRLRPLSTEAALMPAGVVRVKWSECRIPAHVCPNSNAA